MLFDGPSFLVGLSLHAIHNANGKPQAILVLLQSQNLCAIVFRMSKRTHNYDTSCQSMIGEDRQLVTDEQVEFEI